jgi:catechol 2,3-dioxygenase-like lactoylglutathione lyase family enzyme
MEKLRITAMDHIVLNVRDAERALAFYCGVLGLPGERLEEFRRGEVGFPSVRINESTLIDLNVDAPAAEGNEPRRKNLNHYCLVAEDIDLAALSHGLKSQGVTVTQEPVSRWGARGRATSIYILDPDGNEIEIRRY